MAEQPVTQPRPVSRSLPSLAAALVLVTIFALYMVTYVVRLREAAIVTTFERATPESVQLEPGLHFKWPWPVQRVVPVDQRYRGIDTIQVETVTGDSKQVLVSMTGVWRVSNPFDFYQRLRTPENAETTLRDLISERTMAVIGQRQLSSLVNVDPAKMQLPDVEREIQRRLEERVKELGYGVEVKSLSVKRLGFSEAVTENVQERMKKEREVMVSRYRSEGESRAQSIQSLAKSQADMILSFTRRRAETIRSEGQNAAADWYRVFTEDPQFAAQLRELEMYRQVFAGKTVFVIDQTSMGGAFANLIRQMQRPDGPMGQVETPPVALPPAVAQPAHVQEPPAAPSPVLEPSPQPEAALPVEATSAPTVSD